MRGEDCTDVYNHTVYNKQVCGWLEKYRSEEMVGLIADGSVEVEDDEDDENTQISGYACNPTAIIAGVRFDIILD